MATACRIRKKDKKRGITLLLLVLPCFLLVLAFNYLPLWGWSYAFYNYQPGKKLLDCTFVGWDHFTRLFMNPVLFRKLKQVLTNTFAMAGLGYITSPLPMIFAIFLSEMRFKRCSKFIQTVTTLPHFLSWIVVYSLAYYMFSAEIGFVNTILKHLGVVEKGISFLTSSEHVWITMKGYQLWKEIGWNAIIYIAAISSIDQALFEAAAIDGANRMQKIWHITIPSLIPTYFVLLVMSMGNLLNTGTEQYLVFSNAMNKDTIQVLDLFVYNQGIGNAQYSYATAVGIMKSAVALCMFCAANVFSKKVRGTSIF